ncbi:hypothetical protein BVC93_15870 [Mycobacterium sp. MS1601]|uniref:hypothetical protein n=1 Tax=Mycobacterium sp. MS1601 TaxID=1936029 RepID=UPI0009793682|nr:hypothetical protein [Mycobacterium sp. MS1601]AQA03649.1 hypothetical protein BVC93_15870 [Mycobacterium sp. MS1601]
MTGPVTGGNQLNVDLPGWLAADGAPMPPPIVSDPPIAGTTPIEQLLQTLILAANQGDPKDNAEAQKGYAERKAITEEALQKFPAQDEAAKGEMQGVDQMSQMAQQMPQMIGGVAGAISGALGGALQPLSQIPQQLAQTGQQLLQQGMGAMQKAGGEVSPEDLGAEVPEFFNQEPETGSGGGGSGGGGGGIGGTAPMSALGPAATPTGSTAPTSGRAAGIAPAAASAPHTSTPMGGMGGFPMMPPGAMGGAGGAQDKDDKAATKRVSAPAVKNGAPVQGRISTPPPAAPTVTKNVEGKPVSTRRIVVPTDKPDTDEKGK